ncbi:MAG: succinylglutamate desuccinylase/aspartoacylase family protein [Myxococcota bacterium]
MLTEGTRFLEPNVPLHVFEAHAEGPTLWFQGGIHGDEVAGVHALCEFLEDGIRPARGKLIICPLMNAPAYRAKSRRAPGGLDLNRCFPGNSEAPEREMRLAAEFMKLIQAESPALVVTLHESQKRYDPKVVPSFGQSIVYGVQPMPEVVGRLVDRLNEAKLNEEETWAPLHYPVDTSSTEVIVDAVGCTGLCVETWMGFPEERRVSMQRQVVAFLLDEFGAL